MERKYAKIIFEKNKNDYNLIAVEFSRTRHFNRDIKDFSKFVSSDDRILDIGCGNGRLLDAIKKRRPAYIGLDVSKKLINIAKENYPNGNFQVFDGLTIPFPDDYFDKVFAIRVLHHIPSKEFRQKFLKEIRRVLKPQGLLILTVWSWHSKDKRIFPSLAKVFCLKLLFPAKFDFGDSFISWQNKVKRYYHFFTKRGLEKLVKNIGFKIKQSYLSPKKAKYLDIYLVAEKTRL